MLGVRGLAVVGGITMQVKSGKVFFRYGRGLLSELGGIVIQK